MKSPRCAGRSTVLRRGEALTEAVELGVDLLIGDPDLVDDDLDVVQVRQRDLGSDVNLGREPQRLPVGEVGDLDLGPTQRLHLMGPDGRQQLLRNGLLDGLSEDGLAPDPLIDDRRRHLALPETGDGHLGGDLAVRLLEARLELGERHLDRELHPRRAQILDGALHGRTPRSWLAAPRSASDLRRDESRRAFVPDLRTGEISPRFDRGSAVGLICRGGGI